MEKKSQFSSFCFHGERQEIPSLVDSMGCCPLWTRAGLQSSSSAQKSCLGTKPKCAAFRGPRLCPVQGCAAAPRGPAPASLGEGLGAQPREQSKGMLLDFFRKPAADNPIYWVNAREWLLQSLVQCAGLELRAHSRSSSKTLGQQGVLREPAGSSRVVFSVKIFWLTSAGFKHVKVQSSLVLENEVSGFQ